MRFRYILLSTCLTCLAAPDARALTYTWDGGAGTPNWLDVVNWPSNVVPTSNDSAYIYNGSVIIAGAGAVATQMRAGGLSGNTGTLTIQSGSTLSDSIGRIAEVSGSTGVVTGLVTVTGSESTWTSSGSFYIGSTGTGTLAIADGGVVSGTGAFIANWPAPIE